jgi:hypothetical protein
VRTLRAEGITGKRGKLVDKGYLYKLLNNRVYVGQAVHKGTVYLGEHKAIISQDLWDKVHAILRDCPRRRGCPYSVADAGLAKGPHLRSDRLRHVADAHAQGRPALSLLCQPVGSQTRSRRMTLAFLMRPFAVEWTEQRKSNLCWKNVG